MPFQDSSQNGVVFDQSSQLRIGALTALYSYMSNEDQDHKHARDVHDFVAGLRKPWMPIGGPYWSPDQIALLDQWMKEDYQP